ncbi:sensor histidine kinase, partial [Pseudoalteromonas sp. S4488]
MGEKALALATSIASRDDVQNALQTKQGRDELNTQIEHIRALPAASCIVIGAKHSRRLFPPDPDTRGKPSGGGDSTAALRGERY